LAPLRRHSSTLLFPLRMPVLPLALVLARVLALARVPLLALVLALVLARVPLRSLAPRLALAPLFPLVLRMEQVECLCRMWSCH
jgi:hypothetical protein